MQGNNTRNLIQHLKLNHTLKEYAQFLCLIEQHSRMRNTLKRKQNFNRFFAFNAKYRMGRYSVSGCKVLSIRGKHSTHLMMHLKKYHPREYLDFLSTHMKIDNHSIQVAAKTKHSIDVSENSLVVDQKSTQLIGNKKIESDLEELQINDSLGLLPTKGLPTKGLPEIRKQFLPVSPEIIVPSTTSTELGELRIDVSMGSAKGMPELLPQDSPLTELCKRFLPVSPKNIFPSSTCTELEETTLPGLLSPLKNETLSVHSSSYTNLRLKPNLLNLRVPLISDDETWSVKPFSVEIDLPKMEQDQRSNNEILSTFPGSNMMPLLIPIQEDDGMILQLFPIIENVLLKSSSTTVVFSPETKLLLSEQLRKHVQLLTQMSFTAQQSALTPIKDECRAMLQDLVPFKQRMNIVNLDEALDLITHYENFVSKPESKKLCELQIFGEETQYPYAFNSEFVKMMGESRVFMYPDLLPGLVIHKTETETCLFSPYEDQLIAMGIEQFIVFCTSFSNDWLYQLDHLVSSMIAKHILPQWSAEKIRIQIEKKCLDISPANPIKYYLENNVAPPIEHVIRPFYSTRKLKNVPPSLLPDRWRELYFDSTVTVPSPVQLPVKEEISIASLSENSLSVKVFPAKVVNGLAFGNV